MPRLSPAVLLVAMALAPQAAHAQASDASFAGATRFGQRNGAALYAGICQGCHMPDGRGAVGAAAYPALAGNPRLEAAGYPVAVVVNGQKAMPSFRNLLDDAQIAAVVNYVRTSLGNDYRDDPATPEQVRAARP